MIFKKVGVRSGSHASHTSDIMHMNIIISVLVVHGESSFGAWKDSACLLLCIIMLILCLCLEQMFDCLVYKGAAIACMFLANFAAHTHCHF